MQSTAKKLQISCYIRTKNEERRIEDVVIAALKLVDEVVIIDSGSTDKTVELAKKSGAKVFHNDWPGYGKQKRFGEDKCLYDWVLSLDADEILSNDLRHEIRQHFATMPAASTIYSLYVTMVTPTGRIWKGFGGGSRPKLYNKTFIRMPDHEFWDQFKIPTGNKVVKLKKPLIHYAYLDIDHLMGKQNSVTSFSAYQTKLKPLPYVILRVFVGFPIYFFKAYIMRGMIRGGVEGFSVAMVIAVGRWLKDIKLYERHMTLQSKMPNTNGRIN